MKFIGTYSKYPFDYVIGSVHYSNNINIFKKDRWGGLEDEDCIQEKELYYNLIQQSAKSSLFDILGHIDAMKGYFPRFSELETDIVDKSLQVIADYDVAIEVNTSGKTKDCGGWYPSHEILERACYFGVKATFGSDAHTTERVAEYWEEVRICLKEIGYKEWAVFREGKREMISL